MIKHSTCFKKFDFNQIYEWQNHKIELFEFFKRFFLQTSKDLKKGKLSYFKLKIDQSLNGRKFD